MTSFDFQLPESDLIDRIRNGVRAHQADNTVRDRLARLATDDAAANPGQERPAVRLTAEPSPRQRAGG